MATGVTQFSLFAIRQKSTRRFLPERRGRGHSASVPVACDGTQGKRIRLFHTRKSAQMALTAWLQGEWVREKQHVNWLGEEYDEEITIEKREDRKAEDMEIVEYAAIELPMTPFRHIVMPEQRVHFREVQYLPARTHDVDETATPEDAGKLLRGEIS